MFTIGRFSKITGVSTQTLIWYDKVGLLKPAKVDETNGYRYYDDESFKRLADIHFFQSMDFSVKEMVKLSDHIIDDKIETLEKKINYYLFNIELLKKIKEKNMGREDKSIFNLAEKKMSIFGMAEELVKGKWEYRGSTINFKKAIENLRGDDLDSGMPKNLFFGQKNVGTDLENDVFGYSSECFTLEDKTTQKNRNFWFFLFDHFQILVLYEKPLDKKDDKPIKFHLYERQNNREYTSEQIYNLAKKYSQIREVNETEFNDKLVGLWNIYDEIFESEIDGYDGTVKTEEAYYTMSPLFDVLEIDEKQNVHIMEKDKQLEISSYGRKKLFTYSNTVLKLEMNSVRGFEFYIDNILIGSKHYGKIKTVENQDYLFVNLDNNKDIDEKVYVYKKQGV